MISPTTVMPAMLSCNSHGSRIDSTSVITSATLRRRQSLVGSSRRQRTNGPIPISNAIGAISQVNMVLKNGSPIEMLPRPNCLCTSGSSVPNSTTSMAAISSTLLPSKKVSREKVSCCTRLRTCPPLTAYSSREPPITITR
ncbi:hypothetical protein D3C72_1518010 [compost metagenome]